MIFASLSVIGICLILGIYGLVIYLGFPKVDPEVLRLAVIFGLIAGIIFVGETLLEYIFLPQDNTVWGLTEFGSVFFLYFLSSLWVAYHRNRIRSGVLSAVLSAMVSALIWLLAVLIVFYVFRGTVRQAHVFQVEGNYEDFANSGMTDFNAFIMEDFLGAGFFHLLLGPLLATILGVIGGLLGRGIAKFKNIDNYLSSA